MEFKHSKPSIPPISVRKKALMDQLLANPTHRNSLLAFTESRQQSESVSFLLALIDYQTEFINVAADIWGRYGHKLGLSEGVVRKVEGEFLNDLTIEVFSDAKKEVHSILNDKVLPKYTDYYFNQAFCLEKDIKIENILRKNKTKKLFYGVAKKFNSLPLVEFLSQVEAFEMKILTIAYNIHEKYILQESSLQINITSFAMESLKEKLAVPSLSTFSEPQKEIKKLLINNVLDDYIHHWQETTGENLDIIDNKLRPSTSSPDVLRTEHLSLPKPKRVSKSKKSRGSALFNFAPKKEILHSLTVPKHIEKSTGPSKPSLKKRSHSFRTEDISALMLSIDDKTSIKSARNESRLTESKSTVTTHSMPSAHSNPSISTFSSGGSSDTDDQYKSVDEFNSILDHFKKDLIHSLKKEREAHIKSIYNVYKDIEYKISKEIDNQRELYIKDLKSELDQETKIQNLKSQLENISTNIPHKRTHKKSSSASAPVH